MTHTTGHRTQEQPGVFLFVQKPWRRNLVLSYFAAVVPQKIPLCCVHSCSCIIGCEAEVELAASAGRAALEGAHVVGHDIARLQRLVAVPRRDPHDLAVVTVSKLFS